VYSSEALAAAHAGIPTLLGLEFKVQLEQASFKTAEIKCFIFKKETEKAVVL